jgi:hypothetical protein
MNPKIQTFLPPPNPLDELMETDNTNALPAHIQQALNTPPKGHLATPRNERRAPDAGAVFSSAIPTNLADANTYIAAMHHPHTRKNQVEYIVTSIEDASEERAGVVAALLIVCITSTLAGFYEPIRDIAASVTAVSMMVLGLGVFLLFLAVIIGAFMADSIDAPTTAMKNITSRSINVSQVSPKLARDAWDIYCFDTDHYDEFVQLITPIAEHPAERGTKTYDVQREIIDTFVRTSKLRQQANKAMLVERATTLNELQHERETQEHAAKEITDASEAEMLKITVLDQLKADEKAARAVYGKNNPH